MTPKALKLADPETKDLFSSMEKELQEETIADRFIKRLRTGSQKTVRIKYQGTLIKFHSNKSHWESVGAAKSALMYAIRAHVVHYERSKYTHFVEIKELAKEVYNDMKEDLEFVESYE